MINNRTKATGARPTNRLEISLRRMIDLAGDTEEAPILTRTGLTVTTTTGTWGASAWAGGDKMIADRVIEKRIRHGSSNKQANARDVG
jgi:hypothetical protein